MEPSDADNYGVVALAESPSSGTRPHLRADWNSRRGVIGAIAIALLLGALDGYFAFTTDSPGASLAGHCLLVAGIALVVAGIGWSFLCTKGTTVRRVFFVSMLVVGFLATWWAWAFAMPAAMAWDSGATPNALAAMRDASEGKTGCVQVSSGSVGPLSAPYQRCASTYGVEYYASASDPGTAGGLLFQQGTTLPPDQCLRHLVGNWYAFTEDPAGATGYAQCEGGG